VREYVAFIGAKVRLDEATAGEQVGQADGRKGEIASAILMSGEPETKGITQAANSEFAVTAGVTHGNRVFLVSSHNRLQDRHRFERLLPQLEAGIFVSVISFYALGSKITLPLL